ncbi:2TM domain-containing protein [Leptolyngbya sp. FACHB-36]|uniref:2TM domain-containing protein n=1 Tax=Leptolyngbya sp. FACHB-36 TaxID=2692808 RepID=UPI0016816F85|nr:2TM domain-containing protein [Leptolyngbya sp. FACHB-36]MBD2020560.1 2TM domain-containing protein [Leptolyngbya sp. FACHB-36]
MPPRWSRKPDRADPEYRRLDDRMNFATHVAIFAATNSGLWFFRVLGSVTQGVPGGPPITPLITEIWALVLLAHAVFIFAIAKYTDGSLTSASNTAGIGFKPTKSTKG